MNRWLGLLALASIVPAAAAAQDTTAVRRSDTTAALRPAPAPTVSLSLAEALGQARSTSPTYRQTLNDAAPARWGVRNAYGNLLPSASVSGDLGYIGSGQSNFGGGFVRPTSAFLTSGYSLGVFWQLDGRVLSAPGQQKALQRATEEDIGGAGIALQAEITTQYLNALQTAAQVGVARQQVLRNADFLALANARYEVGQATLLDVRQAQVAKGQSDVALLRAAQANNEAKLDLIRRMGVEPPAPVDQIALTDSFPVQAPEFQLAALLSLADEQNPTLRSLKARQTAATWSVRAARSEFLPTLQLQAGWSGFTQQLTDESLLLGETLTSAQGQAAECQYDNQVRTALNLGGQVQNCFG
nr:TolC family protein [Gemmatimonadales bacterium]